MTLALIADDEGALARHLQQELSVLWPELEFTPLARNGLEAAQHIADLQPDLAFLDIRMPGLTGLEVAQGIEGQTRVVFVTAYDEYAVKAFDQQAIDYVLKPVKRERLQQTVQRLRVAVGAPEKDLEDARLATALDRLLTARWEGARRARESHGEQTDGVDGAAPRLRWIRASAGDLMHQIPVEEVLFFRADDKYTCVQTAQAEHLIRTSLAELLPQLDPTLFVQVHRSTVVNLQHLAGTRRDEASRLFLRLRSHAQELPVSRAYVHLFRAM